MAQATGTLTMSDVFITTETVVVGGKTYTFQATLTDVDGNVQMGAAGDEESSLLNLLKAINLSGVAGVDYAASMTRNNQVKAVSSDATTLVAEALADGTVGNLIASTETLTNGAWGAVVLEGGTGAGVSCSAADLAELRTGSTFSINAGVITKLLEWEGAL